MSEQPNLTSTYENYGSSAAAYSGFPTEANIALHESDLPSPEEGRRLARERIVAAFGPEVPPVVPGQTEIAQVGMNITDFRLWQQQLMDGASEETRTFRVAHAAFERQATGTDQDVLAAHEEEVRDGSDEASESLREVNAAFGYRSQEIERERLARARAAQPDIMGYEPTFTGN